MPSIIHLHPKGVCANYFEEQRMHPEQRASGWRACCYVYCYTAQFKYVLIFRIDEPAMIYCASHTFGHIILDIGGVSGRQAASRVEKAVTIDTQSMNAYAFTMKFDNNMHRCVLW